MIRFLINNDIVELNEARADLTLLQFIREHRKKTGTKEGCAAGDCGACTVVLVEPAASNKETLHYRTVNSCITLMSAVHGKQLLFVEHLSDGKHLHPVQQALVDHHGTQCGFCTPGFIMSMFALYHSNAKPNRDEVLQALSGNLCRCTGYRPIIDATLAVCEQSPNDQFSAKQSKTLATLLSLANTPPTGTGKVYTPTSREELKALISELPNAQLVAGSTDLSLQFTQQLKNIDTLISVTHIDALKQCTNSEHSLIIGAAVALSDAAPFLLNAFPQVAELVTRFASLPIRNQATIGGNVANASPIGDMPPLLLALNATLHLDNGDKVRTLPISEFFTGYRETQLVRGEWISAIEIPLKQPDQVLAAYKVSKRFEDDISAVCAVFNLTLNNGNVAAITTGFGGVAAIPSTCQALENALKGKQFSSSECLNLGKQILFDAFTPIDDVRATAEYRKTVLANLWHRFWLENQSTNNIETRVVQHA
ncbi:xanthine dehydrogenase small subunit [Alteromonas mediterranea]|uniref:xanthine dehydrogenase small subunit n=1 Tax=Alteromonas mediterranea TaxID=314275 RepID=UPI0009031119|nr:xanthine dehydrogenase small subunit [Alteromonas mediterranea]APD93753.1 xanthine dehydrogenase small subunit [Alteromonas mediterranea]APD97378.1 xanthine dehydrogenase small subunit [Alteromonas mediterranea]